MVGAMIPKALEANKVLVLGMINRSLLEDQSNRDGTYIDISSDRYTGC